TRSAVTPFEGEAVAMNPLRWNRRQGLVFCCGALVVVALLFFPPWRINRYQMQNVNSRGLVPFSGYGSSATEFLGYAPLLRPPPHEISPWENEYPDQPPSLFGPRRYWAVGFETVYTIDWALYLLPMVVVCSTSAAAICNLRSPRVSED